MGLFSFLGGKKEQSGGTMVATESETPRASGMPTEAAPAAATSASVPAVSAAPSADTTLATPPASSGWDTSFTAPEAWNTGALTAPVEAPAAETPEVGPADPAETAALQGPIIEAIKTVYDPEI